MSYYITQKLTSNKYNNLNSYSYGTLRTGVYVVTRDGGNLSNPPPGVVFNSDYSYTLTIDVQESESSFTWTVRISSTDPVVNGLTFVRSGVTHRNSVLNGWEKIILSTVMINTPVRIVNSSTTLDINDEVIMVTDTTEAITITLFDPAIKNNESTLNRYLIATTGDHTVDIVTHDGITPLMSGATKLTLESGINTEITMGVMNHIPSDLVGWGHTGKIDVYSSSLRVNTWADSNFKPALIAVPMDTLADETNDSVLDVDISTHPTRVTAKIGCICEVGYNASIDSTGGSTYNIETVIRKNGTELIENSYMRSGNFSNEDSAVSANTVLKLVAGDYIELMIKASSGFTGTLNRCGINVKTSI